MNNYDIFGEINKTDNPRVIYRGDDNPIILPSSLVAKLSSMLPEYMLNHKDIHLGRIVDEVFE